MSSHDFYLFSNETFWTLWQDHQNYLYRCCVKWMGSFADAEDALSQAMFKAHEKIRNFSGNIKSFKAWLTQLTHNVCMDIYRKDDQRAKQVESWEFHEELVIHEETPILLTTQEELENFFEVVIDELPSRLRETFILHFKEQLSYQEIGEKLNIAYDNVRKRISQARAILKQRYHQDFLGEENRYSTDLQSFRYQVAPQSRTRKKSENMIKRKVDIDDTSVLSDQLEIVPIVEQEKSEPAVTVSPTVVVDVQSNLNREVEEIEKKSDVNEEYVLIKVRDFWQWGNLQKIVQLNHKLNWGKGLINERIKDILLVFNRYLI
jgi:RNA polymerase sigma factor (sigma-70 family)